MAPTILITGCLGGIGQQLCRFYAKKKWHLLGVYHRGDSIKFIEELFEIGAPSVTLISQNLAHLEQIPIMIQKIMERHTHLDALINNAAVAPKGTIEKLSISQFEECFRINTFAPYELVRNLLPYFKQAPHPSIVNVSSIAGQHRSLTLSAAYSASKAALNSITRHLAVELAPHIRINAVCPSQTETPLLSQALTKDEKNTLENNIPLKRLAQPSEVVEAIHFLVSPKSSYIHGSCLSVNGGQL